MAQIDYYKQRRLKVLKTKDFGHSLWLSHVQKKERGEREKLSSCKNSREEEGRGRKERRRIKVLDLFSKSFVLVFGAY